MLTTLRIKNIALVTDLTLEFQPGYNVITGETGAGKSILIGALNLVLGARGDRTIIRTGADSCTVEALFDISRIEKRIALLLEENGLEPCEEHVLSLKRTLSATGGNKQFINHSPASLQVLATIGDWLVDIHGPHDHQSLLQPARQLAILDSFAGLGEAKIHFADLIRQRARLQSQRSQLLSDGTVPEKIDLLQFQAAEIEAAKIDPAEEETLEEQHQRASNSKQLLQLSQGALAILGDDEQSIFNSMGALGRMLQELSRIDSQSAQLAVSHQQLTALLSDLQSEISSYADRIEIDPARLAELEERIDLLQNLKRKYGPTLADVVQFGREARERLDTLNTAAGRVELLESQIASLDKELVTAGTKLSQERRKAIPKLVKMAKAELVTLGFAQAEFDIRLTTELPELSDRPSTGFDTAEFLFAPNPGEPPRPLRSIASSGEMARVMLALKTALAAEDEIPVLIFDEVDANVGGETAAAVGQKMLKIAGQHQVLCITHLAPVAACAHAHYLVSKQVKAGRTISEIAPISQGERIQELARMLGGATPAARKHAESLLAEAKVSAKMPSRVRHE